MPRHQAAQLLHSCLQCLDGLISDQLSSSQPLPAASMPLPHAAPVPAAPTSPLPPPCPLQDYNREVLATLTIPNVHANLAARQQAGSAAASSRYWAGDWLSVGELLISHGLGAHYDVLLAAETIYSEASQEDLLECIKQVGPLPAWLVCALCAGCRQCTNGMCVCAVAGMRMH